MNTLFLIVPALLAYTFVLVMFLKQAKAGNNILFGVTLPAQAFNDSAIKQLQINYKKSYTIFGIISLFSLTPLFFLSDYFSMALIYLFIWFTAFIYTSKLPFKRFHHQTAVLKREKDWFVGQKRIIRIDTKVNILKNKMVLSPYWFLIPALISVSLIIASIQDENILLKMTGIASLIMTVVLFVFYYAFRKMKPKVYSEHNDINAAINQAGRRYWSILWLSMAIFESFNAIVAYTILTGGSSSDFTLWIIGIVMVSLVPLGAIFFVHNKVRSLEESLAISNGLGIITDDDEYWINGSTYYNPNDQSVMVPNRIGIGTTVNMATRAGKWIKYGGIVLAIAIILPLTAFAVQSDNTSPYLYVEENSVVKIDYPMYDFSFPISDVQEITLEESLPTGFRTNGTATAEYARGHFSLENLGDAKLYIFKNSPPYIFIKLDGLYVIFNDQDPASTKAIYDELNALKTK
ncbi:DUF5808 domain-containing protein [Paenibacillus prosopidis]|uniref:Putative membrane protein n=1 Tax=Paenibacillus prosopidis TaxID=630520 RepID=A0A368VR62_9BACL|nr:DUF5808 domain-containing protein [Paenibacillus prosopidis]RCW44378.1 putative membrane protein [Paenibacillus prosopidis]